MNASMASASTFDRVFAKVKTGLRLASREWRSGDLLAIAAAIVITTASLVSVLALTDRVHRALAQSGSELLAADLVVEQSQPITSQWRTQAKAFDLEVSQQINLRSVVMAVDGEGSAFTELKAVDTLYPLRGTLTVSAQRDQPDQPRHGGPASGSVWLDSRMLDQLGIDVGQGVRVGERELVVEAVVVIEPDRGGGVFAIAPRLIMSLDDMASTALIQPGSVVSYSMMVAGDGDDVARFREWIQPQLASAGQLRDATNTTPRFSIAVERAERFLGLAALVGLILAGAAIARAAGHFAARHLDAVALLRGFGASHTDVVITYTTVLVLTALVAGAVGTLIGYLGQWVLAQLLPGLTQGSLPQPSARAGWIGMGVSLVVVLSFSLPALWQIRNVPPLRVLRRSLTAGTIWGGIGFIVQFLTIVALVLITARDLKLAFWFAAGTVATLLALAGLAMVIVLLLRGAGMHGTSSWRYGVANIARRPWHTVAQTTALGVGIMVLLLLTLVRSDLLNNWLNRLPVDTPNHFLVNIGKQQQQPLSDFLTERGITVPHYAPMLRARIVAINGQTPNPEDFDSPFARRQLQREANLSWRDELAADNDVVSGEWWQPDQLDQPLLSVEEDYANDLGLKIGDELTYRVGDRLVTFAVHNLRKVDWDSFQPNFFLLTTPQILKDDVYGYIASVYVPPDVTRFRQDLAAQLPNLTDIDVDALLQRVRRILNQLNTALQFIFLFTLAAGIVVLATVIYTSIGERSREFAVLRALGTGNRPLSLALVTEYAMLGIAAGLVGAIAAAIIGHVIARYLLSLDFAADAAVLVAGISGGLVIVSLAGLFAANRVMRTPPWTAVRR